MCIVQYCICLTPNAWIFPKYDHILGNNLLIDYDATHKELGCEAYHDYKKNHYRNDYFHEALLHKSCPEDSPHESSVIAGVHEQLAPYELQDQKLVTL